MIGLFIINTAVVHKSILISWRLETCMIFTCHLLPGILEATLKLLTKSHLNLRIILNGSSNIYFFNFFLTPLNLPYHLTCKFLCSLFLYDQHMQTFFCLKGPINFYIFLFHFSGFIQVREIFHTFSLLFFHIILNYENFSCSSRPRGQLKVYLICVLH